MLYKQIIQELKYHRQRLGIGTQVLAEKIGVADSLVTKWESYSKIPNGTNLVNWINALGFNINLYQYKKAIDRKYIPNPKDASPYCKLNQPNVKGIVANIRANQ